MEKGRKDLGMDFDMAQKDRAGWTVDISDVTGSKTKKLGEGTSQEVGNMADMVGNVTQSNK